MAGTSCVKGTVEWFSQNGSTEMPPALSLPLLNDKRKGVETRGWSAVSESSRTQHWPRKCLSSQEYDLQCV